MHEDTTVDKIEEFINTEVFVGEDIKRSGFIRERELDYGYSINYVPDIDYTFTWNLDN